MPHLEITNNAKLNVSFQTDEGSFTALRGDEETLQVAMKATRGGRCQLGRLDVTWEPAASGGSKAEEDCSTAEALGVVAGCSVPEFEVSMEANAEGSPRLKGTMFVLPDGQVRHASASGALSTHSPVFQPCPQHTQVSLRVHGCEGCLRVRASGELEAGPPGWFASDRRLKANRQGDGSFCFLHQDRVLLWSREGLPYLGAQGEPQGEAGEDVARNGCWRACPPRPAGDVPMPGGELEAVFTSMPQWHAQIEPVGGQVVPGLLAAEGLLLPLECDALAYAAEQSGYDYDPETRKNARAEFTVSEEVGRVILERCLAGLPDVNGAAACGLNPIFRCYKYAPGDCFRLHYDRSSLGAAGLSCLSLLIYLSPSQPERGGATTFLTPAPTRAGGWTAVSAKPEQGGALFFFHGEHPQSPLHEGGLVNLLVNPAAGEGPTPCKLVLRTDVMYTQGDASAVAETR